MSGTLSMFLFCFLVVELESILISWWFSSPLTKPSEGFSPFAF
jgi:hypothetical protein